MKRINIVLFGLGNVGSTLIRQILDHKEELERTAGISLNLPVILNSTTAFFQKEGIGQSWEADLKDFGIPYKFQDLLDYIEQQEFENLIAVDATASEELANNYTLLIRKGFHIVAANKIANTLTTDFYKQLRKELQDHKKHFFYETNVGAGLPVVETLKNLHISGEKVTKIRGVFSGSLSYIFNTFSNSESDFDIILTEAGVKGFTEPDPRIDLSGKDVARKLLILARELNISTELHHVTIQDLVPVHLNGNSSLENFRKNQKDLNPELGLLRTELKNDEVIRHIGELDVATGTLEVKLVKEKKTSPLGSLKYADASFEIYTESYGDRPIVIQGAGAGAAVTARGVFSDVLKISQKLPN